eukprot:4315793-Amphidinium_carterae.1
MPCSVVASLPFNTWILTPLTCALTNSRTTHPTNHQCVTCCHCCAVTLRWGDSALKNTSGDIDLKLCHACAKFIFSPGDLALRTVKMANSFGLRLLLWESKFVKDIRFDKSIKHSSKILAYS